MSRRIYLPIGNRESLNPTSIIANLKTIDGSGSGLDADLLDGVNLNDIVQKVELEGLVLIDITNNSLLVLNSIKTVDGAGSGLDADLLDGNEGAYYAPQISTYTKTEVDTITSSILTNIAWKGSVATFTDLATTYPTPIEGWTASVNDVDVVYRYNGINWIVLANGIIPLASILLDGKMSASDFTKLQGIQTSAQVNPSNTEILNSIKTVDGAGSGLDADLLDGNEGAYYAKSSDVMTNTAHRTDILNPHSVTKSQIGLSNVPNTDFTTQVLANSAKVSDINHVLLLLPNVDNTSDLNKPISTLTLAALNNKLDTLSSLSKTISGTVKALCIYNTINDYDGGAWRDKCESLGYYNEPLNTLVRGKTKKFPAIALIVVFYSKVVIYDVTDKNISMWMVFPPISWNGWGQYTSITASNGVIYTTSNMLDGLNGDLAIRDFTKSYSEVVTNTRTYYKNTGSDIRDRNITGTGSVIVSNMSLASSQCNKVLIHVLHTAPIDTVTGLPIPIIYVASTGGVTRIAEDKTTSNWNDTSGMFVDGVVSISIYKDQLYIFTDLGGWGKHVLVFDTNVPLVPSSYLSRSYTGQQITSSVATLLNYTHSGQNAITNYSHLNAIATNTGLIILEPNVSSPGNSIYANITSKFNTGFRFGNTIACWLADTIVGTSSDSNIFPIGSFASPTGWILQTGWSISGSNALINSTATAGLYVDSTTYLTIGKWYNISIDVTSITAGVIRLQAYFDNGKYIDITTPGVYNVVVNMHDGGGNLNIWGVGATTATINSVTIIEMVGDRTSNSVFLTIKGTLTTTPVAAGSELVAYSGWSNSNYLQRLYDSRFIFGTSDLNISCWFNNTSTQVIDRRLFNYWQGNLGASLNKIDIFLQGAGNQLIVNLGLSQVLVPITLTDLTFRKLNILRKSGILYVYLDKILINSTPCTDSIGNSVFSLYLGQLANITQPWLGGLTLFHIGHGAPTPQQVEYMYDNEKTLFDPGSACTLDGVSDDCTVVTYDESFQLRHVATTTHKSVFKGLNRVSSKVGTFTSLSAIDNYVLEGN